MIKSLIKRRVLRPIVANYPRLSRVIAKSLFRASGVLSHVKLYRQVYSWEGDDSDGKMIITPAERRWVSCPLSTKLLTASMQFDWDHWDHWACVHDHCNGVSCLECGGAKCREEESNEANRTDSVE